MNQDNSEIDKKESKYEKKERKQREDKRICTFVIKNGPNKGKICNDINKICKNVNHRIFTTILEANEIKNGGSLSSTNPPSDDYEMISLMDVFDKKIIDSNSETGFTYCVLGSSKSGKTTLSIKIFEELKERSKKPFINFLYSMSLNAKIYEPYKKDKMTITVPFFLPKLIKSQYKINSKMDGGKNNNKKYKFFNFLDDIVDAKNEDQLKKMFLVYRNSNISTGICLHNITLLGNSNRGNVNYMFFLKLNNSEMIETAIRKYLMSYLVGDIAQKINTYVRLTQNYGVLFLDLLNNCLYYIKQ